jgi:hypothetical protein
MRARARERIALGIKLCGAKTRAGRPCIRRPMPNGRCRNHGGLNPTWAEMSPERRAKCLAGLKLANERHKAEKAAKDGTRSGT